MVPTFIIDTPAVFAIGIILSFFVVDPRGEAPFARTWPFGASVILAAIVFGTAVASYRVAPDWMVMYYLPEGTRLSWQALAYMGVLLYAAPAVLGFVVGRDLRRRARGLAVAALLATVALQALVMWHVWDRYVRVATVEQWRASLGTPLPEHEPLARVSAVGAGLAILVLGAVVALHVPRRRAWRTGDAPSYLNEAEEGIVAALAGRLFPEEREPDRLASELSSYIGSMVFANRAGIRLVLAALQWLPPFVIRVPRRFTSLAEAEQDAYLAALEKHGNDKLRAVLIILKTTLCLLYYERPEVLASLGAEHHCLGRHRPLPEEPQAA